MSIIAEMENPEFEKSKALTIVDVLGYTPNAAAIITIIKGATGDVTAMALDAGQAIAERISPFDIFIQIIDGEATIAIDGIPHRVQTGQSIIVPAHTRSSTKANISFKMIMTTIKSGYEELV
jgi:quercetin dioxygenase-like cupin family protein